MGRFYVQPEGHVGIWHYLSSLANQKIIKLIYYMLSDPHSYVNACFLLNMMCIYVDMIVKYIFSTETAYILPQSTE